MPHAADTSEPAESPLDRQRRHLQQRAFLTQAVCLELEASAGDYDCERVSVALYFVYHWLVDECGEQDAGSGNFYYRGLHEQDLVPDPEATSAGLLAEVRAGAQVLQDAQLLRWADLADYDNDLEHITASLQNYLSVRGLRARPHSA
ncbi:hypothetical protein ACFULT_22085 [Rhodococcus sp. NPDC057297]|uniref:hypothetical protein n=1 Tax=Rhodococcus sp. NPDC057297 TaxID=3346090 RepID=UPI0036361658